MCIWGLSIHADLYYLETYFNTLFSKRLVASINERSFNETQKCKRKKKLNI